MINEHLHKVYEEELGMKVDPLRFNQFQVSNLGVRVLGSITAFNLWLSCPERKELFTTIDGTDNLYETLIALDEGYF